MSKVKITVLKTTLDKELARGIRSRGPYCLSPDEGGADILCGLC